MSIEEDRIQLVKNWPELKSIREIQVFVGFANFYRRFIKGFSYIIAPLIELIKILLYLRIIFLPRGCLSSLRGYKRGVLES